MDMRVALRKIPEIWALEGRHVTTKLLRHIAGNETAGSLGGGEGRNNGVGTICGSHCSMHYERTNNSNVVSSYAYTHVFLRKDKK